MSPKQETKSKNWLAELPIPLGLDPLLELMKRQRIPLTLNNYLRLAYPEGVPESAEVMELVPQELRPGFSKAKDKKSEDLSVPKNLRSA